MSRPALTVALVAMNWPGYQSLALGYLSAYALADRRLAGQVGIVDMDLTSDLDPWWVAYRIIRKEPDVVGFSATCWNARKMCETCSIIKAARPETFIVAGGPEVGPIAEETLRDHPHIDAVVRGEGEETFADLLHALLKKADPARVEGVTARRGDQVVSAPDRALIADLDSIPSPYTTGRIQPAQSTAYIETYRGCPYHCGYCFEGKGYGRMRHFSQERVASEVGFLAQNPSVREFSFVDPVFNLNEEHLKAITDILRPHASNGMRLHTIEVDIERIGPDQARMLREAGVGSVETGPQSVGSKALDACRRKFDRERFASGVAACRAEGISVECDLIIGLPGDTVEDVLDGLRFCLEVDPGKIQLSSLHVLPGTDIWERAEELGVVFNPQPPHEVIQTSGMDFADLRRAEVLGIALADHYRARV